MTLGGLALAVGILVDDATVTIEKHQPSASGTRQGFLGSQPYSWKRSEQIVTAGDFVSLAVHVHRLPADVPGIGRCRRLSCSVPLAAGRDLSRWSPHTCYRAALVPAMAHVPCWSHPASARRKRRASRPGGNVARPGRGGQAATRLRSTQFEALRARAMTGCCAVALRHPRRHDPDRLS